MCKGYLYSTAWRYTCVHAEARRIVQCAAMTASTSVGHTSGKIVCSPYRVFLTFFTDVGTVLLW